MGHQGHPTRISSQINLKHFLCYAEYFRPLEMNSKWCYKISICSVILGELESFRNYKGFSIIFRKILDAIQRITKKKNFLIPLSITFFNPKILGFLFPTKNSLTWDAKCEKSNFRKSQGIYQISFENCTGMERSSRNFQPSSSNRKFQAILASPNRYFTENSGWVPLGHQRPLASRTRTTTSTKFDFKVFRVFSKYRLPESFILPYFTRKVSTVIFSEGGQRSPDGKMIKLLTFDILFSPARHSR